jgi:hypothetical protein
MNTLMIAVIALVAFIYCGGSRVPPVLRQNKDMILGVVGGLVLGSFFGLRLEGMVNQESACDALAAAIPSEDFKWDDAAGVCRSGTDLVNTEEMVSDRVRPGDIISGDLDSDGTQMVVIS